MLVRENRLKFAASSDLYFSAEMTPDALEPQLRGNMLYNDRPKGMHLSHLVFNPVYITWRGRMTPDAERAR